MKEYIKWMEKLPRNVKIILCIAFLDYTWCLYRLFKAIESDTVFGYIQAIILFILGFPFVWIADLILMIYKGKILWINC